MSFFNKLGHEDRFFPLLPRQIRSLNAIERGNFSRFLSLDALKTEIVEEELICKENGDDLKSRILRLRLPKRSATNIIQKWVNEGNTVTTSELRNISKELRKYQRYKHALEVSETSDSLGWRTLGDCVKIELIASNPILEIV